MRQMALKVGVATLAAVVLHRLRRRHRGGHEDVVRAYFDAWSDGDGEAMRDLVSDDYQAHVHMLEGTEERDADELISVVGSHAEAFSEVEYELHEQRWWLPRAETMTGRMRIGFMHVPADAESGITSFPVAPLPFAHHVTAVRAILASGV